MSDRHTSSAVLAPPPGLTADKIPLIALAGQPNMGKSTLFNLLTGLHQHVGNWPGKTVERREGRFVLAGSECHLVDLPGTYSLTANSPEEVIAREFILREHPDLVVALVSAANLERSLYLVAELIALPTPLVVALNMMDVAAQEGIHVEPEVLEAALGVPVVPITASRCAGIGELLQVIQETLDGRRVPMPRLPEIRSDHRQALQEITTRIAGHVPQPYPCAWAALKLLEGDAEITRRMQAALPRAEWEGVHQVLTAHDDAFLAVASGRYEWIGRMVRAAVVRPRLGQVSLTERLDRWAAHPVWGLAILAGILGLIFGLTFSIGAPVQAWLDERVVGGLASLAGRLLAGPLLSGTPFWVRGFVVDGVIGGVGSVITFLPIMVIFFAVFALLEDVGYMARAAYVMDNLMHLLGLHGKSFLPLFLGFGCNVPAILGTRVIELVAGAPADHPDCPAGALHRPHGGGGLPGAGLLRRKRPVRRLGVGAAFAAGAGLERYAAQPGHFQRPALSLHHGNAALPPAQRPHDRPAGLAEGHGFRQESRDGHPGDGAARLGALGAAQWGSANQLPGPLWTVPLAGGELDGSRLAPDGRSHHQLPRQRKRHRHAGRALWQ